MNEQKTLVSISDVKEYILPTEPRLTS